MGREALWIQSRIYIVTPPPPSKKKIHNSNTNDPGSPQTQTFWSRVQQSIHLAKEIPSSILWICMTWALFWPVDVVPLAFVLCIFDSAVFSCSRDESLFLFSSLCFAEIKNYHKVNFKLKKTVLSKKYNNRRYNFYYNAKFHQNDGVQRR